MAENNNQDQRIYELAKEIAVLEQKMETHKQEYKTDIARLAEQMAQRDTDAAKRESRLLLAMLGGLAVVTAVLGVLITAQ